MSENFLTKTAGPLPVWGWLAGGGIGLFVLMKYRTSGGAGNSGTPKATPVNANNGNKASPNIFFLPQGAQSTPSQITVNVNRFPGNGGYTGQPSPPPTPTPHNPPPGPRATVTVKKWPGNSSGGLAEWDTTLWGIANHFNTSVSALAAANHIANPNLIYPGQHIVVPQ